jgi:hypothetical protein
MHFIDGSFGQANFTYNGMDDDSHVGRVVPLVHRLRNRVREPGLGLRARDLVTLSVGLKSIL